MSATLVELVGRKDAWERQLKKHYADLGLLQDSIARVEALLAQVQMLEIVEEEPEIEAFELDANFEYDDEGSYFWSALIRAKGEAFEVKEYEDWEVTESVREILTEQSAGLVFGDNFEGVITVEELRKQLLEAS